SPRAGCVDDDPRGDATTRCHHAGDPGRCPSWIGRDARGPITSLDFNASNLSVKPKSYAVFTRLEHEAHHHAVRIDEAVRLAERAADYVVDTQLRHKLHDVSAGNQFHILNAKGQLSFAICFEIIEMPLAGGAEQIAVGAIISRVANYFVEARKEIDRVARHLNVYRRGKLRPHAAHTFSS